MAETATQEQAKEVLKKTEATLAPVVTSGMTSLNNTFGAFGAFLSNKAQILDTAIHKNPELNPFTAAILPGVPMPGLAEGALALTDMLKKNIMTSFEAAALQGSKTPAEMLDLFAKDKDFQTDAGKKMIDIARNDPKFAEALHNAITKDPSVAPGLLSDDGDNLFQPDQLVKSLEDPNTRQKFTDVLNAVAKSPNDKLDFKYLGSVVKAAQKVGSGNAEQEDYKKLKKLLEEAGIHDAQLDFASEGIGGALNELWNNPKEFFDKIRTMMHLDGTEGGLMNGLLDLAEHSVAAFSQDRDLRNLIDYDIKPLIGRTGIEFKKIGGDSDPASSKTDTLVGAKNDAKPSADMNGHFTAAAAGAPEFDKHDRGGYVPTTPAQTAQLAAPAV